MLSTSDLGLPCNNRLVKCEATPEPADVKIVDGYLQKVGQLQPFSLPTPVQVAEQPDNGYLGFKKAKEIVDFDVVCWAVANCT